MKLFAKAMVALHRLELAMYRYQMGIVGAGAPLIAAREGAVADLHYWEGELAKKELLQ